MADRIALGISYNGTEFNGWQKQPEQITIQSTLEYALSQIAHSEIQTICAGRTDAGVHAANQVVHFETSVARPITAWCEGTNTYLPKSLRVHWVQPVPEHFHARFSALSRCYHYWIYLGKVIPHYLTDYVACSHQDLDVQAMQQAAQLLLGEHDFSSFRSADCQARTTQRNLQQLDVEYRFPFIRIKARANAFLHHMVRKLVGVLWQIGLQRKAITWAHELLLASDHRINPFMVPAWGLHLMEVEYPEEFLIPKQEFAWLEHYFISQ